MVFYPNEVDCSLLKFSDIRTFPNGGTSIGLKYLGGPLTVQTDYMVAPFGVNNYTPNNSTKLCYSMHFNLTDKDFLRLLENLDTLCIERACELTCDDEDVPVLNSSIITDDKGRDYVPMFRAKIRHSGAHFDCRMFARGCCVPFDPDMVAAGREYRALIELKPFWVSGKGDKAKCGISWTLRAVQEKPLSGQVNGDQVHD